jgi:hypothetical protein
VAGGEVGMELAAEFVELALKLRGIDVHLGKESEERKIIDWARRLHVSA